MTRKSALLLSILMIGPAFAGPVLQMNRAFGALSDLIPFINNREAFTEKKYEKVIDSKIVELQAAFKNAKHEPLLKEDLFAPSYAVINENIANSYEAFKAGKKDYAHWRLKEITNNCLDCHTRLPTSHPSSFQNGELIIDKSKFDNLYNLGIAQLIVRRYVDAKTSFIQTIDDSIIKKDFQNIMLPFKQLLLVETKVLKNPENLISTLNTYARKKEIPEDVRKNLGEWAKRLQHWKGTSTLNSGLTSEKKVTDFINQSLQPLKKQPSLSDGNDVDLLFASGLLSNYLFENPTSSKAPEISYWLGWAEKHLKRENFFGSGDRFLKQCVKRYPSNPIAKRCLEEYRESVEFEFTGSSGTNIPEDIEKELDELAKLIKSK